MTGVSQMTVFYLDSSALVKRYIAEQGSSWIVDLCLPAHNTMIATERITKAEVASAMARKYRNSDLTQPNYQIALQDLTHHFDHEYILVEIDEAVVNLAVELTTRQKLRGYDAIQLAAALSINTPLTQANFPPITFIAADENLLQAADSEGLKSENPNIFS